MATSISACNLVVFSTKLEDMRDGIGNHFGPGGDINYFNDANVDSGSLDADRADRIEMTCLTPHDTSMLSMDFNSWVEFLHEVLLGVVQKERTTQWWRRELPCIVASHQSLMEGKQPTKDSPVVEETFALEHQGVQKVLDVIGVLMGPTAIGQLLTYKQIKR